MDERFVQAQGQSNFLNTVTYLKFVKPVSFFFENTVNSILVLDEIHISY